MPWNECPRSRGIDAHLPWNAQICCTAATKGWVLQTDKTAQERGQGHGGDADQAGPQGKKTRTRIDGQQVRVIGTDMELFVRVLKIAERRAARVAALTFEWGEDDYPDL